MTGRRPSRGDRGDPWRGGRPPGPDDADRGGVELEDLPVQVVSRPRKSRVSVPAAFAGVALVGLLAAGMGALGGRPETSAGPGVTSAASSDVAAGSPSADTTPTGPLRTPAVTPFRPCRPLADQAPSVLLRVDGVPAAGTVTFVAPQAEPTPDPEARPLEIPADASAQLWIGRDICAHAWSTTLFSADAGRFLPLDLQANAGLDPAFASQNRFDIPLGRYRLESGPLELRATLEFPEVTVVAAWPIRFLPFERPQPRLLFAGEDRYVPTVEGCDVILHFRNGVDEAPGRTCEPELVEGLTPLRLEPGTPLRLIFDGWTVTESSTTCRTPLPSIEPPTCWDEPQDDVQFVAPRAGDWILEIAACAVQGSGLDGNRICGTWFVRVLTQQRQG